MVPASFVPDKAGREFRELVRYRRSLIEERTREKNRIRKVLEGANLKLGSVVSEINGKAARAVLAAVCAGESDPAELTKIAGTQLRATPAELRAALEGTMGAHQRLLVGIQQRRVPSGCDFLSTEIARVEAEIAERSRPFRDKVQALDGITGVGLITAQTIIAEIGTDMRRFPTSGHLTSWARICPGTHESAGKRSSARIGKGNRSLRAVLIEAAHAAGRSHNTSLGALYRRLAARIGKQKAAVAVARHLLVIAYHMLKEGTAFTDLGGDYYTTRDREAIKRRAIRQLERAGFVVTIQEAA